MNNNVQKTIDTDFDFLKNILKPESAENNKKASSFYDDYVQRTNQSLREAINKYRIPLPELKPTSKTQQTTDENPQYSKFSGSKIKKNIESVLSKKYGELDTKHIFDGIDDKDIEDNIQTAENTIQTNIDRGFLNQNVYTKYPNMRDGLALSYAAADKGKNKAATRAREAAYMEQDTSNVSNEFFDRQPAKTSGFYDDYIKNREKIQSDYNSWYKSGKTFDLPKTKENPRYVGADVLNMRNAPGTSSKVVDKLSNGTEVNYTGNKTNEIDGHLWAEVKYGDKTGWVAADYLKTAKPQNSSVHTSVTSQKPTQNAGQNFSMYDIDNIKTSDYNTKDAVSSIEIKENKSLDWTDARAIRNEFNKEGNHGKMQCADLSKWVIDKHTDLRRPDSGNNGNVFAQNIANLNGLKTTHTPCAPAIFSVKENAYGPGITPGGVSHSQYGHTGMALSVKDLGNDMYEVTYIDTYAGYNKDGYNSNINTRTFKKDDNVTYVSLEGHLK